MQSQIQLRLCRANSHMGGHAVKGGVVQFDEKVNYLQTSSNWLFLKCHPEERPLLSWRGDLAEAPLSYGCLPADCHVKRKTRFPRNDIKKLHLTISISTSHLLPLCNKVRWPWGAVEKFFCLSRRAGAELLPHGDIWPRVRLGRLPYTNIIARREVGDRATENVSIWRR